MATDIKRALLRGIGPDRGAEPLPLRPIIDKIKYPAVNQPKFWPAAGTAAAVVAVSWLLREIELSASFFSSIALHPGGSSDTCGWAEWLLPVSKADWTALGKSRASRAHAPRLFALSELYLKLHAAHLRLHSELDTAYLWKAGHSL